MINCKQSHKNMNIGAGFVVGPFQFNYLKQTFDTKNERGTSTFNCFYIKTEGMLRDLCS